MKRYNDILLVGIDHGYGNIKTAGTVTPTGITKLDAEPTFSKGVPALTAEMPKFLASLMLSLNAGYPMPAWKPQASDDAEVPAPAAEDDFSDIDMDFIGG